MEIPKSSHERNVRGTEQEGKGIPPSNEERLGHGQTPPNLQSHGDAGSRPQKGGTSQTGQSGGLDRNQDSNKQNREGEMPKSEADILDEPPFDSRMPGEPPRGADNTAPGEN